MKLHESIRMCRGVIGIDVVSTGSIRNLRALWLQPAVTACASHVNRNTISGIVKLMLTIPLATVLDVKIEADLMVKSGDKIERRFAVGIYLKNSGQSIFDKHLSFV